MADDPKNTGQPGQQQNQQEDQDQNRRERGGTQQGDIQTPFDVDLTDGESQPQGGTRQKDRQ